jgi:hypothetical protein
MDDFKFMYMYKSSPQLIFMSIDNSLKLSVELRKIEDLDQEPTYVKDEQFFTNNLNDSLDIFNILKVDIE